MNDISDPEERDGYKTVTYAYHGNDAFGKAIKSAEALYGKITVLRTCQGWHGTTVVYRIGDGKP